MDAKCPRCGEELEADNGHAGQEVKCPTCAHVFVLSAPPATPRPQTREPASPKPPPPSQAPPPSSNTKVCPFCSEQILATAQKCKHCGEFLNPAMRKAMTSPSPSTPQVVRTAKSRGIYIILGLFLGGLFGIHNFYAGRYGPAVAQLLIMLILGWFIIGIVINVIWVLIELCSVITDGNGNAMT